MKNKIEKLEKGKFYKIKEWPYWDKAYTIFCPNRDINVKSLSYYSRVPCLFKIVGYGQKAKVMSCAVTSVRVENNNNEFLKVITLSDYVRIGNLLKKEGLRFDKHEIKLTMVKKND